MCIRDSDDVAGAHDEYLIGLADGGEAVRDDEARAALHQLRKGALYALLGARVDGGRGLVEDCLLYTSRCV